ncbi:MAG: threonyl-tRNA synthetase editing domain-containing protein, partial [Candidatus Micrarchaeota archaeon]
MRILTIHADFIEVEAIKKAIADAEKIDSQERKRYDEVLVVFTAIELGDEDVAGSARALAHEADAVAQQVKAKNILLYPLVHLTSKPSSPRIASAVVLAAEEELKKKGYEAN